MANKIKKLKSGCGQNCFWNNNSKRQQAKTTKRQQKHSKRQQKTKMKLQYSMPIVARRQSRQRSIAKK